MFVDRMHAAVTIPMKEDYVSLRRPIEREKSGLVLRVPLDAGGEQLRLVCEAISEIDGNDLVISIPDWLAEKIEVGDGTEVCVDDRSGKLNITKALTQ